MIDVLYIPAWDTVFENAESRKIVHTRWCPVPNKQDGDGYTQLIEDHPNGAAHFGAWNAIVQTASKCKPRGTLIQNDGTPHTSLSLRRKTKIPMSVFDEVIPRLIKIGWLDTKQLEYKQVTTEPSEINLPNGDTPQHAGASPQHAGLNGTNGMEWNGMERTERKGVVDVLLREGFGENDPIFDDPNCTPCQVQIAIDNANASKPADRRGFIVTAIQKQYSLSKKALARRKKDEAEKQAVAEKQADEHALAETIALDVIAPKVIKALPPDVRAALEEIVLKDKPAWRNLPSMRESIPMFKLMYKIHQESA